VNSALLTEPRRNAAKVLPVFGLIEKSVAPKRYVPDGSAAASEF
jgi:hypothetical protein